MTATFMRYPFAAPVEVARNLVPNPTIEMSADSYVGLAGSPTLTRSQLVTAYTGAWSLRALMTTTATNDIEIPYTYIEILPNTQYTFSFYNRAGTNARDVRAALRFYTAAGAQVGTTTLGTSATNSTGWTRYTVTATSGATAVRASPILRVSAPAAGESHYFDGIMLNVGAAAGTYFDGTFPEAGGTFYRWVGFPHMSASVAETVGASDILTPTLGILTPYTVRREARTVVHTLLDSSDVRVALVPAGPRKGQMQALFDDAADAMDAVSFFSGARIYEVTDEAYASMWFAVTDGEVQFEQTVDVPGMLTIPFAEVEGP